MLEVWEPSLRANNLQALWRYTQPMPLHRVRL